MTALAPTRVVAAISASKLAKRGMIDDDHVVWSGIGSRGEVGDGVLAKARTKHEAAVQHVGAPASPVRVSFETTADQILDCAQRVSASPPVFCAVVMERSTTTAPAATL